MSGELLTVEEWAETPAEVAIVNGGQVAAKDVTAEMVTAALVESRSWLAVAMQSTDPTPIAEFKAWAATVQEATRQKQLGREIELDAAEMVRRAERGIGVAIRNGQEAGEIARTGGGPTAGTTYTRSRFGRTEECEVKQPALRDTNSRSTAEFFAHQTDMSMTYAVTDGVTDEEFEVAVTEAKAEGNLSRANVVRKVKRQPAPAGPRPELLRGTRHHDSNRIVQQTVIGLEGFALGIDLIDFAGLDRDQVAAWSQSLTQSLRSLNALSRRLKDLDQT